MGEDLGRDWARIWAETPTEKRGSRGTGLQSGLRARGRHQPRLKVEKEEDIFPVGSNGRGSLMSSPGRKGRHWGDAMAPLLGILLIRVTCTTKKTAHEITSHTPNSKFTRGALTYIFFDTRQHSAGPHG